MATFTWSGSWTWFVTWNAVGFVGAFVLNSFVEWAAHRFVLHGTRLGRFAYDLHDRQHHVIFDGGALYHAQDEFMRTHVTFVLRDYILFLLVTTPLWVGAELLVGRPLVVGGVAATLAGLQLFNSLHWRYHVPSETWFQRTRAFQYLKEHHRAHHEDTRCNFNVAFFPIADLLLGTLRR
ncbi:MAG: sterol desaturase family protein [Thermoplasmata archaeon]